MKRITILGSTGSIGTNCLRVIEKLQEDYQVAYLSTHVNVERLYQQTLKFKPRAVAITGSGPNKEFSDRFKALGTEVFWGNEGLLELARREDVALVVNALVGGAGLKPTLEVIKKGKNLALANKESLVMAGALVMAEARQKGVAIIPIDSEHSAVFQCLAGEDKSRISRIILTASGGPFWNRDKDSFNQVTVEEALQHPNWNMGRKITIDSATLFNKGLEVIEAHWLFGLPPSRIEVIIHPQSIVHSLVEFVDGSIKAQLGIPDMRIPIQYALTYPDRLPSEFPRLNLAQIKELNFYPPDLKKFRPLALAYEALRVGGTAPAILNGANEAAVKLFLDRKIRFDQISSAVEEALSRHEVCSNPTIEDILKADNWAREFVTKRFLENC